MAEIIEYQNLLKGHLGELASNFDWYYKYKVPSLVKSEDIGQLAHKTLSIQHAIDLYNMGDIDRAIECLTDIQW